MKLSSKMIITCMALILCTSSIWLISAAAEEMYRIKPGDQLTIYVHENQDLNLTVTVLSDGTISFPLVGNLYVQGLTVSGLQDILTQKLSTYLQKPIVVITLGAKTVDKVYIIGEVRSPFAYPFHEGYRLTDYLAIAGGPTSQANWKKCFIYSSDSTSSKRLINLTDTFSSQDLTLNPILNPNDTVYLEKKSGFVITSWGEIGQVFGIIVGITTLYFISVRR